MMLLQSLFSKGFSSSRVIWRSPRLAHPVFFIACTALVFLLYNTFLPHSHRRPSFSDPVDSCPAIPPKPGSYTPPAGNGFKWRDIPVKYPVHSLMTLPFERPSPLPKVQYKFRGISAQSQRQEAVKHSFKRCWSSYKERAWMKDELTPVSGKSANRYGGWGATLFDSIDTLWLMGMREEYEEAVTAALSVDISPGTLQQETLSVFETNIRFIGALLAAYDLTECKDKRLLDKAVEFGDMLYVALDTPNRTPVNTWSPHRAANGEEQQDTEYIMSQMGSLSLEFTHLSQLTGDMRWYDAVQRLTDIFDQQQSFTKLPGLWPLHFDKANTSTLDFTTDNEFSLGANADSTYEYFLKMFILLGGSSRAQQYRRIYQSAANSAIDNLLFRPMVPGEIDILLPGKAVVHDSSVSLRAESEHLEFFLGGMFALGGRMFEDRLHVDIARKLTKGFIWAYDATPSGVAPENFFTVSCDSKSDCAWDAMRWLQEGGNNYPEGFVGTRDAKYLLRPEAVESVFYLYRITGEKEYQDIAWRMFETLDSRTRTEFGNAELMNVFEEQPSKKDQMESFWLGETLKYLYLTFSPPDFISLDDFVFNTEAHPFRIPKV